MISRQEIRVTVENIDKLDQAESAVSESIDRSISANQHVDVSQLRSLRLPLRSSNRGADAVASYKTLRAPASKLSTRAAGAGCDAAPLPAALPPPAALLAAEPESGTAGGRLIGGMPA